MGILAGLEYKVSKEEWVILDFLARMVDQEDRAIQDTKESLESEVHQAELEIQDKLVRED